MIDSEDRKILVFAIIKRFMDASIEMHEMEIFMDKAIQGFNEEFPDPTKAAAGNIAMLRLLNAWKEVAAAVRNIKPYLGKKEFF